MEYQKEQELLSHYASISKSQVLSSQSDLDAQDTAMPEMLGWCRRQKILVVLRSGKILSSEPSSRAIQNCRIVMIDRGLSPAAVYPAKNTLIQFLLENAVESDANVTVSEQNVSEQQQRLRLLVKAAIDIDASDIHIEVRSNVARIRMRKHGELFLHAEWLPKLAREVVSVAFNKETDHSISHFNPLIPMSASMRIEIEKIDVRVRIASLPAHDGYDVVMRILTTRDEKILSLRKLGYFPDQIALLEKAIALPYGSVILSGPTGSGKTTTLASCMQLIDTRRKVFTIEDPVEKLVATTTQVPVNTEHYDRDFASMARTVLRMDPDVIVLGEMRDEDTASVMLRAAITGHLVFSTVHTNSATGIITRLIDLGIAKSMLATPDVLTCLICQRLVPVLCKHCCSSAKNSQRHARHLERWKNCFGDNARFIKTRGVRCEECRNLGIQGRTVIAEMIWVDEWSRRYIQSSNIFGWQQYLIQNGWKSYAQRLIDLVLDGRVDPFDAEKLIGPLDKQQQNELRFDYKVRE
jgi:type II secretory ATPase GspE/PulE/Tfp pilus assembly ATPase PilB-like protein